jgi:hypothetical protein
MGAEAVRCFFIQILAISMVLSTVHASPRQEQETRSRIKAEYNALGDYDLVPENLITKPRRPSEKHYKESPLTIDKNFELWNKNLPDQDLSKLNLPDFNNLTPEQERLLVNFFSEPSKIAYELIQIQKLLVDELERLEKEIGLRELEERIRSHEKEKSIEVELKGIGKGEIIFVRGDTNKFLTRLTHYGTHLSYVYLDGTGIEPDNKDLKELIERNIIIGSQTDVERYEGMAKDQIKNSDFIHKKYGRETVVVYTSQAHENKEQEKLTGWRNKYRELTDITEDVSKSKEYTATHYRIKANWKVGGLNKLFSYLKGVYVKPTADDVKLGVLSGFAQFGVSTMISLMMADVTGFTWTPAILSILYGTILGVWNNTYRNIVNAGDHKSQTFKNFLVSTSFAYLLYGFQYGLHALTSASLATLELHFKVIRNNLMNGGLKPFVYRIARERELAGKSIGTAKIRIPHIMPIFGMPNYLPKLGFSKKHFSMPSLHTDTVEAFERTTKVLGISTKKLESYYPKLSRSNVRISNVATVKLISEQEIRFLQKEEFYKQDLAMVKSGTTKIALDRVRRSRSINNEYYHDKANNVLYLRASLAGKSYDTGFYKPTLEGQVSYTVLYTGKMIDLLHVPGGTLIFALMYPFLEYTSLRYFEKNNFKSAAKYRAEWEAKKLKGEEVARFLRIGKFLREHPHIADVYNFSFHYIGQLPYLRTVLIDLPAYVLRLGLKDAPKWSFWVAKGILKNTLRLTEWTATKSINLLSKSLPNKNQSADIKIDRSSGEVSSSDFQREANTSLKRSYTDKLFDATEQIINNKVIEPVSKTVAQKMKKHTRTRRLCRYVWFDAKERRTMREVK